MEQNLLFRFGFILLGADCHWTRPEAVLSWSSRSVGGMLLLSHPEVPVSVFSREEGVIALIGHCFPPGLIGGHTANLSDDELCEVLAEVSGRFALVISTARDTRVFHDAFGARSLFYSASHPGAIASHAVLLAQAANAPKRADAARFPTFPEYVRRRVRYLPGDMTVFENIYALPPNNSYSMRSGAVRRYWPAGPRKRLGPSAFWPLADQYLRRLADFLREFTPIVGVTGGIDSRVLLATLRFHNVPFRCVTWTGSYLRNEELSIVRAITDHLGADHAMLDMPGGFDSIATVSQANAGTFRTAARLTSAMHGLYSSTPHGAFVRGYGGEIIRGFYNIGRRPMRDASIEEMMRAYNSHPEDVVDKEFLRRLLEEAFGGFRDRAGYAELADFGYDVNDIFYWEHRMGMWGSAMLNEMDAAIYSLVGLNSRALFEASFSLPPEERLTKAFLRALVARYDARLAEIPVH